MLRATTNGLYGGPHVALARDQVPARMQKLRGFDPASFVDRLESAMGTVREHLRPHYISVAFDNCVGTTQFLRFKGIESRVDASENHVCATITSDSPNLVPTKCIRGVDAYPDNISGLNVQRIHCLQSLIDQ